MTRDGLFSGREATDLLDSLATAVIVLDRELRVADANPAAESLLATSATQIKGLPLERLIPEAPEFVAAVRGARGEGRTFTQRNLCLRVPHDSPLVVDCTVAPWWESSDEPPFMVLEITNVDRHHRIQAEGHLLVQSQVTTAFLRGLAHEIKNPLGGIRGAAQLLERELQDPGQAEYTRIIIGEADRLSKLVDRMLGPRGATRKRPVNIHDVLERVCKIVEVEHRDDVAVARDYDPSIPEMDGDLDQLIQAFLNIVRNAIEAVAGAGGRITIRTRIQRKFTIGTEIHRLVIRAQVMDTGPGVDGEIAEGIFFPMVSGRANGTGLGLPIAQTLINRHGGLIEFTSEPGNTIFTVWLPIGGEG